MARPFEGAGQKSLMLGAVAGNPARNDFSLFRQKPGQFLRFLEVNPGHLVGTKTADFLAEETAASLTLGAPAASFPAGAAFIEFTEFTKFFFTRPTASAWSFTSWIKRHGSLLADWN